MEAAHLRFGLPSTDRPDSVRVADDTLGKGGRHMQAQAVAGKWRRTTGEAALRPGSKSFRMRVRQMGRGT